MLFFYLSSISVCLSNWW